MPKIKSRILDVPRIQKNISKKHEEFIKEYGGLTEEIFANENLSSTKIASKISRILDCFITCKIIDEYKPCEDSSYRGFHLIKKGFKKSIYIWTDGYDILIKDSNLLIKYGLQSSFYDKVKIEDIDTFDWETYALKILDYIHKIVYQRKDVIEKKIFK